MEFRGRGSGPEYSELGGRGCKTKNEFRIGVRRGQNFLQAEEGGWGQKTIQSSWGVGGGGMGIQNSRGVGRKKKKNRVPNLIRGECPPS